MVDEMPEAIAEFLAKVPEPQRAALLNPRETIKVAAPGAEEYFGYGVPAFRQSGALVSYAAAKAHCGGGAVRGRT